MKAQTIVVDYFSMDGVNTSFIWSVNKNASADLTLKDVVVAYDTLNDGSSGYPYAATVTVDSITYVYGHENNSGLNDTIVTSIVELDSTGFPTSTVLWTNSVITNTSTTTNWTTTTTMVLAPNYTLPTGKKFGVKVQYYGSLSDSFGMVAGYYDGCTGSCAANLSIFYPNSYYYLNYSASSGFYPTTSGGALYYDCNTNSTFDDSNCEAFYIQDWRMAVKVTLSNTDASVSDVYTLGKLPQSYGSPHIVQAKIKNIGSSNISSLTATLNITGANTFSTTTNISSLNAGDSTIVSFSGFTPSATGVNTVTVSVPSDNDNTNNSKSYRQQVTTNAFGYADTSAAKSGVGFNMGEGLILTSYTIKNGSILKADSVMVYLHNTSFGNTVYAVVLDSAGNIIGQSSNFVPAAGDTSKYHTFSITTPPVVSTTFFVGLAQVANVTVGYYPVGTQDENLPTRSGAYYYVSGLTGGIPPTESITIARFMIEAGVSVAPTADALGSASNVLTVLKPNANVITASQKLNTIAFIHRNDISVFGGHNGQYRYDVSKDGGSSWQNNIGVLNPVSNNTTISPRYPQIALHNQPTASNSTPDSAYAAYLGSYHNNGDWQGTVTGVSKLTGSSSTFTETNAVQDGGNSFIASSMCNGAYGIFWAVDEDSINNDILIYKGTWSGASRNVSWTLFKKLTPPYDAGFIGSVAHSLNIAFDSTGQKGWVAFAGDVTSGGDNVFAPVFYETTDGGNNWTGPTTFNLKYFTSVMSVMDASGTLIPTCGFDADLIVDKNGNPHYGILVGSMGTGYDFAGTLQKTMFDFYRSSGTWYAMNISDVQTFGVNYGTGGSSPDAQYNRPQLSKSLSGDRVFITWLDNNPPDIFGKAINITSSLTSSTNSFTQTNPTWSGKAHYASGSPNALQSGSVYTVPTVVTEFTNPDSTTNPVNFYYLPFIQFDDANNTVTPTTSPYVLPPTVGFTADKMNICAGDSIQFTDTSANTPTNWQWTFFSGTPGSSTAQNPIIKYNSAGSHSVKLVVTNSSGSDSITKAGYITVTASGAASVSIVASANPTCTGLGVTFTATPTNGGSSPSYQWKKNGANVGTNSATFNTSSLANGDTVTCVMTSSLSCATGSPATSNAIIMTVNPFVTANVSINVDVNPICTGTTATFTATPTNGGSSPTYQWQKNGSNVGTNSATYSSSTLADADVITCIMTSNGSCVIGSPDTSNSITMTVTGSAAASVSINATSTSICSGDAVTFTASPTNGGSAPTYQWKKNGANVGTNSSTYTSTTLANSDTITCVMTSSLSCATGSPATSNSIVMSVTATVAASVSISVSPNDTVCSGDNLTFTATPTNGGSSPTYQWMKNGANVGTNSTTYSSTLSDGDVITCEMTSDAVCVTGSPATSNSITVTVNPLVSASVSISVDVNPICTGATATFTATPTNGGSTPSYQWKKNGSNVGTNSATFSSGSLADGDVITCVMTSNAACVSGSPATSNDITMSVNSALAASVSISPSDNPICTGASVTFTATPTNGGASPTYQWKKNGANVGTNNATFTASSVTDGDIFTCIMTSSLSCATGSPDTSNSVTMNVSGSVAASVNISATSTSICSGDAVTFTATPTGGGSTPSYQWKKNGSNVGTNSATYTNSTLADNDAITCVMTSSASCATGSPATSNSITITVNPNVAASVGIAASANPICDGDAVTFTATPTNGGSAPSYQWQKNGADIGSNSATFSSSTLSNADVITCEMTSNAVCVTGSPATSNSITMTVNPNVTASVSISVSANPICTGSTATFTASATNGGSSPSYQWKKNGTNVGTNSTTYSSSTLANNDVITCVLTSNAACVSGSPATSNSITMTVNGALAASVNISASANPICAGDVVTFTATPTNGGSSPSYQWKKNGANVGTNSTTFSTSSISNGDQITCTMASNLTCATGSPATSNTITMNVSGAIAASVSISATATSICSGDAVTFTATPLGGGSSTSYQWKKNGANVGTNSANYTSTTLANGDAITCVMTSSASCATGSPATSNSITMTVTTSVAASVNIVASSNPICVGSSVTFTATPTNGGGSPTYQWKLNGTNVGTNSATYTNSSLSDGDEVYCEMTSSAACATGSPATSNSIYMTVSSPVTASVSIAEDANPICDGTTVTFTATPTNGGSSPAYQWKLNGTDVGTNSDTYTNSTLVNGDVITCVMTSNAICVTSSPATSNGISMVVNQNVAVSVSITVAPGDTVCTGDNVTFTATPTNGGVSPSYQWKQGGANVGFNSPTYSTTSLVNGNIVRCIMTSNATCPVGSPANSNMVTMTVMNSAAASVSISVGPSNPICAGDTATFTATPVNGGSTPAYQWKVNGVNSGTNSATFSSSALANNSSVTCMMTSSLSCATGSPATSSPIVLTVNTATKPTITQSGNILTSTSATTYQWYVDGNLIAGAIAQTFTPLVSGDYTVTIVDGNSCSATSDPTTVMVGIEELLVNGGMQVYPNPNTGIFTIEAKFKGSENIEIAVVNVLGEKVLNVPTEKVNGLYRKQINLNGIAPGIYFLQINAGENRVVKKITVVSE